MPVKNMSGTTRCWWYSGTLPGVASRGTWNPSVYYASVCFDEAGEKHTKVNTLFQCMEPTVMYGRMLM